MAQQLQSVDVEYVSLVDRAAVRDSQNKSEPRRFLFRKSAGRTPSEGDNMTPEELQAALEKAEADAESARAAAEAAKEAQEKAESERDEAVKAAKRNDGDEDDQKDETTKSDLPPEIVARIEKAEAEANARIEKAEKDAREAMEKAQAETDRRVTGEFITKAEGLTSLPQEPGTFGVVLKHASEKLSKEDYEAIESVLAAANEQVAKGNLFDEIGRTGAPDHSTDVYAEVQRKAEDLMKSDSKLSRGEAEARVMKEDRALQARYLAQVRPRGAAV